MLIDTFIKILGLDKESHQDMAALYDDDFNFYSEFPADHQQIVYPPCNDDINEDREHNESPADNLIQDNVFNNKHNCETSSLNRKRFINQQTLSSNMSNVEDLNIINDQPNCLAIHSSDVIDLGNNIVFFENDVDTILFIEKGWTKLDRTDPRVMSFEVDERYDIFIPVESGATVQVDRTITTNYQDAKH